MLTFATKKLLTGTNGQKKDAASSFPSVQVLIQLSVVSVQVMQLYVST